MTGADGHAHFVNDRAKIVRMDAVDDEAHQTTALRCLADEAHAFDLRQALDGSSHQGVFVLRHFTTVQTLNEMYCRLQTQGSTHIGGTSLKLKGQLVKGCLLETHRVHHLASELVRRHLLEPLGLAIQATNAHGSVHLMTRKHEEVTVQVLHVDGQMRHRLGSIHYRHRPMLMSKTDHLLNGVDSCQGVRDMCHGHDLGALLQ